SCSRQTIYSSYVLIFQSTRRPFPAATTHARAAPARTSSTAMGRRNRCTELRHPGVLCYLLSLLKRLGKLVAARRTSSRLRSSGARPRARRLDNCRLYGSFNFLTLREPEYRLTSSPRVPLAIS